MPIQTTRSSAFRARRILNASVLIGMLCPALGAAADDSSSSIASMFSFYGFGTLGVVHTDEHYADFVGNAFQPNGAGYTRAWAPGVDSKLGLQVNAQVTSQLMAVVQVISQLRYNGSWTPEIEWANLKYQFTPELSVRAGRFVAMPFLLSDTRLVAYTYTWIRPPLELYGMLPVTNMDGVDVNYRLHSGSVSHSLSVAYGQTDLNFAQGGELKARRFIQASDLMEYGPFTVRIGYTSLRVQTDIPGYNALFSGFEQFGAAASASGFPAIGAQAAALGTGYTSLGASTYSYSLATIGASYDPGNWLLMSEWAKTASGALLANSTGWYVMGGYRFWKLTPYLTVGQIEAHRKVEPGISTAGLPPPLAEAAATLNGGLTAVLTAFAPSQSSATVGVRWDVVKDIDLKLQYDRVRLDHDTGGRLENVQPGFQPGNQVNVFSLAMDFVF
jgi:hypothetical protein